MAAGAPWRCHDDELLMALIPPFGPHASLMANRGVLKVPAGCELTIERSELTFLDASGGATGSLDDAFGLAAGSRVAGPLCRDLRDTRARPAGTALVRWSLGDRVVAVATDEEPARRDGLRAYLLPLQVTVPDDFHAVVHFVHGGSVDRSSVDAVRQAGLWVDGRRFASATGVHWDGPSVVRPGGTFGYRFSLADFPGAPREGEHEVSLEMFGLRSASARVRWAGEPWAGSAQA